MIKIIFAQNRLSRAPPKELFNLEKTHILCKTVRRVHRKHFQDASISRFCATAIKKRIVGIGQGKSQFLLKIGLLGP